MQALQPTGKKNDTKRYTFYFLIFMDNEITITGFDDNEDEKNIQWERNHLLIVETIDKLCRQHERLPYIAEIAEESSMSRSTVYRHLKQIDFTQLMTDEMQRFRLLLGPILGKVGDKAKAGDIRASRLALQLMGMLATAQNKK